MTCPNKLFDGSQGWKGHLVQPWKLYEHLLILTRGCYREYWSLNTWMNMHITLEMLFIMMFLKMTEPITSINNKGHIRKHASGGGVKDFHDDMYVHM